MHDAIHTLRRQFDAELAQVASAADLRALRDRYLARKGGLVSNLLKAVAAAPAQERPVLGRLANETKQAVETAIAARQAALEASRAPAGAVDVTLPGRRPAVGRRHPLTIVREEMESIFSRMGFEVVEGPEIEDDWHNFEALNMPPEHPARDMQDTLYLAVPLPGVGREATLLRTHTSPMQIRYMEQHRPPVRIIAPGRSYRRDNLDPTHTPMFSQVEGLVVGEGVSLADLKGTLFAFAREIFGASTRVHFRPSFFPYTEPSAEMDVSCFNCGGTGRAAGGGCSICKRTGWLEVLGSGMVHPAVFEAVGYDPEQYTGFAFGVGIERIAMLRHGVEDIRYFYENDLRFLEQFPL
ncbi:MAG TPA: phenylalanine--tRNA ligase subunit alpha [Vicinamibacterales bacterium]|nr:phenylalanine--tRNA ligase subunit alpha [Vicinamibacterales bacterium]